MLNETGFKTPLLLNYTQWENGQTGSVGMFGQNGLTSENYRVLADDPWGKQTVVWEARPDSASDADGGWGTNYVAVDSNHYYRFSAWVRRPVVGNGSTYFGCNGSPTVLNLSNGSSNTNPYFWYVSGFSYPDWMLIVGHIHPEGTSAGSPIHPDSGLYSAEDGRIGKIITDFIFANGTTTASHRSYLFYSTNTSTVQQWVYPRMDKCDGTEPSIAELLAGHDSRNFDYVKRLGGNTQQTMSIDSEVKVGGVSEVGITNGLVAYYPLNKDAKDYSGNGYHGTVTGAVLTGGGFDGKGAYRFDGYPHSITGLGQYTSLTKFTYSAWINRSVNQDNFLILGARQGNNTYISMAVIGNRVCLHKYGFNSNLDINVATGNTLINTGVWRHIVITYDEGITKAFVDGALDGSGFHINTSYSAVGMQINYEGGVSDTHKNFKGDISNVKIFNRALTPEEIAVEYKRTGVSKMTQHNGTTYIQGQVKETI